MKNQNIKYLHDLLCIKMNENTFVDGFFFRSKLFLTHCFSLLSAFLSSKSFWGNEIHCGIIDRYVNEFFVEIQLKNENLISVFWVPKFGCPNLHTGLPNGLDTSLHLWIIIFFNLFFLWSKTSGLMCGTLEIWTFYTKVWQTSIVLVLLEA